MHGRRTFLGRVALVTGALVLVPACQTIANREVTLDVQTGAWTASDGTVFPAKAWLPTGPPKAVVISLHGLSGAIQDHSTLGQRLSSSGYAVYAYALRGQGMDPVKDRVGDIRAASDWVDDLWAFHRLVSLRHPGQPIVWHGESLGGLISVGAVGRVPNECRAPVGLILSSPIPAFDERVSAATRQVLGGAALFQPKRRIPLSAWAGGDEAWQVTHDSNHLKQLEKTPWAVQAFSVRFYHTLALMVGRMMPLAPEIAQPTLLLHAEQDYFAKTELVKRFAERLPQAELVLFPKSRHLLFYDVESEAVIARIHGWLLKEPWKA